MVGGRRAVEPGERGATRIADRVVTKIASQAAREALDGARADDLEPPHATVAVHEGAARVRVSLELAYPVDIGARCRAVRSRIVERVHGLAGMDVPEVVISVERLHSPHMDRTGGERVR
ncbi:hypothetical protein VR41_06880 [Streptomyces sp. NRRL B-1568]|nr:hypothetical protein VR41_06880 [Streptomyces sp. NRRL B-1568]